ncbi:magnesium transporter CorA family protein [Paractinoplanes lichenicola]|uniref:Magnesium transporter CorA family protein n=1 Tax=Paractinoplanes lichenicola TaxID=2802976 RepID=A0ABS1VKH2_9ACTN|nr:magnesium transporter CorA family protein [Actinoplanes lichenicola]MBL7254277.1 magnesium transporter CorA family protein [Actinoplanes lichenicola]
MTSPSCPTATRLYEKGTVLARDFGYDEVTGLLEQHPDAVLWLDLFAPEPGDLELVAQQFDLHPLAVEDAMTDHERPKLDRYPHHVFLNVYAVDIATKDSETRFGKTEISAFVTPRALITVRKSPSDTSKFVDRWDAASDLGAADGVGFLLYGLLDVVVDGQYAATQGLDTAMDQVEDALLEEGGAPRAVRMKGIHQRKLLAALRRAVAPMPELVGQAMRTDLGLVDANLKPYYRDVEDHAQHTLDEVEHLRDRIDQLLQADTAEQGNVLNDTTRKLAAWAAIVAVPTALTGYFGQNVPYPGYEKWWGFLVSSALIVAGSVALYYFLKRRGWL